MECWTKINEKLTPLVTITEIIQKEHDHDFQE
jgi:hypothetical protein